MVAAKFAAALVLVAGAVAGAADGDSPRGECGQAKSLETVLKMRGSWIAKAEAAKPKLIRRVVAPANAVRIVRDRAAFQGCRAESVGAADRAFGAALKPGDSFVFDFGRHLVGHLSVRLGERGDALDAPCRIKFTFAEVPGELSDWEKREWRGLCRSWFPEDTVNFDFAPMDYELPRRYAFRYVKLEVVACPPDKPVLERLFATSETSADESRLMPWTAPNEMAGRIDRVACNTLRDCMQTMFEDGPKRDRRLWLGDLRLEALANYVTYRNFDVVKRSLYLLAGTAKDNGLVGTDAYERPFPKKGDCRILDYTVLFPTVVLEYLDASGDRTTAEDLWPLCVRQAELVLGSVGPDGLVRMDRDWWYFIDHAELDRQVPEQGVIVYGLKRLLRLSRALGRESDVADVPAAIERMAAAAKDRFWKPERGLFAGTGKASYLGQA